MQSPIDEFHKEQQEAFASYNSVLKGIELRMKEVLEELRQKDSLLALELENQRRVADDLHKQKEAVAVLSDEYRMKLSQLEAANKQLEVDRKNLEARNIALDQKHKAQNEERERLSRLESELNSREKFLEIADRRNKHLDYKLNLIAGDAKIKAELEKLEGIK